MATTDHRSPTDIEREIEQERAGLTGTLDELQNRFSFDRMTTEAGHFMRSQSGDIMHAFSRAVRENPMAVAITGVGIAWMILGARGNGDRDYESSDYRSASRDDWEDEDDFDDASGAETEDYSASTVGSTAYAYRSGTGDRYAGGLYDEGSGRRGGFTRNMGEDDPDWVRGYADVLGASDDMDDAGYDDDGNDHASAPSSAERMKEGFRRAGDRMRHGGAGRIEKAKRRLSSLRERLAHGTEDLSEESRRRVVAARERAMEARHSLTRRFDQGSQSAADAFERQPLAAGALAFAAGAAIAAALPRTQMEDEYLGEHSDHLMEEAERVFEEERAKLGRVARATADEAKAVMGEKTEEMKEGMGAVQEEARGAAERIATKAKDEAKKEKLGQPGSSSSTTTV